MTLVDCDLRLKFCKELRENEYKEFQKNVNYIVENSDIKPIWDLNGKAVYSEKGKKLF